MKRKNQQLKIILDNVSQADAIALIKMFKYMQYLGSIGSSRMCSFYADGDGSFRPKISFEYPETLPEIKKISGITTRVDIDAAIEYIAAGIRDNILEKFSHGRPHEGDFVIGSDVIAWKIYH